MLYMLQMLKKTSKVKKTLSKWVLMSISENQAFQRTAKFIMAYFYEIDSLKILLY